MFLSHLSFLGFSFYIAHICKPLIEVKGVSKNISFFETIFSSYEIFVSSREIFVSSYEIRTSYELFETSVGSEKSELMI
jgi:hypothetical protein